MTWCIIFVVAVITDILTTLYILAQGGIELNPLMVLPLWAFLGVKILTTGLVIWWYRRSRRPFVPIVAGGSTWGAVLWNFSQVLVVIQG